MTRGTHGSLEHALGLLIRACAADDAGTNAPEPPASGGQIAALERYWGRRLPPLYRRVLGVHNGIPRLWFDVALLAIETIIDGSRELHAVEAASPAHERWIFARSTESRDALAFDPSSCSDAMLTYRAYWESWLYASDANPPAKPRPRPTPSPYFDPAA